MLSDFQLLRERAGLSQKKAADYLGISTRQVRRYEAGESKPPEPTLRVLRTEADLRPPVLPLKQKAKFTFIDLFAGIGGLRIGFEKIGGRCVFTSEWDRFSQETYRANFPSEKGHVFAGDIRPYGEDPSLVPKHDVLLAGFPANRFRSQASPRKMRWDVNMASGTRLKGPFFSISRRSLRIIARQRSCWKTSRICSGMTRGAPLK